MIDNTRLLLPDEARDALRALHHAALAAPALQPPRSEEDERLLARFERLLEGLGSGASDIGFEGRDLMTSLQSRHPELWVLVDRALLWYFGGECLHFLSDEEIAAFQRAEDAAD